MQTHTEPSLGSSDTLLSVHSSQLLLCLWIFSVCIRIYKANIYCNSSDFEPKKYNQALKLGEIHQALHMSSELIINSSLH